MFFKALVIFVMIAILAALGTGLAFLVRDGGTSKRTVKALTWRIGLSIALFLLLFLAFFFGLLSPHGL